ncbi:universal stress protein [Mycolicibacterium hodleri]|uniref:Universal stress protein n=1 Tax=Mycolicibacterium hodleri TaxID=49897 RepID=A0A502EE21_9MYCO|nr:universal stress protein [Mycolicibacterium hodleri]TPG35697.1 universal stress protein [Mycolicibacterium hodleri]
MKTYRNVVVGTDGSDSSLRAVDRAGNIAATSNANLIVATAYLPSREDRHGANALKDDVYQITGSAPIYARLRDARERAKAAGAANVKERAVRGAPIEALVDLAKEVDADLLVVGSVGLHTVGGRLFGSVPGSVSRRATTDVLIVHTA